MNRRIAVTTIILAALALACVQAGAAEYAVGFTKLTGLTGGSPAGTAVYRADLSAVPLASILSISITDNSGGLGGATGKFSGFDLDAIKLIGTSYGDAASVAGAAGLSVFDFTPSGTSFVPGTQRPTVDPELFGTSGGYIDNSVATLGAFDANSTTDITAFGFASLGDNGDLTFNLTGPVSTSGMFLYIGEVGDNGEVAAGSIRVSDRPKPVVPEVPAGLLAIMGSAFGLGIRKLRSMR
ncbi:MAG: PEP-CTERM sorting domain-containing protein [Armatimonadetes bacterium]|nr:PEP-CTERM sorting domain-containing protein [Armatimonadota bacterium]